MAELSYIIKKCNDFGAGGVSVAIGATKAIRAMDRADAKTVPIIAMTANAFEEDAKRCLAAGMTAHLAKPFQIEDVEKAIVECCGK